MRDWMNILMALESVWSNGRTKLRRILPQRICEFFYLSAMMAMAQNALRNLPLTPCVANNV